MLESTTTAHARGGTLLGPASSCSAAAPATVSIDVGSREPPAGISSSRGRRSVAAEVPREETFVALGRRDHRGAGAVAEQDRRCRGRSGSMMRRHGLGADEQHVAVAGVRASTRRRRARRRSPRTRRARSNEPQCRPSASPTNAPVWGIGCSGDCVATISRSISVGVSPALLIAAAAAVVAERRGALVGPGDAPLANTGALDDPRVRRVDVRFEIARS